MPYSKSVLVNVIGPGSGSLISATFAEICAQFYKTPTPKHSQITNSHISPTSICFRCRHLDKLTLFFYANDKGESNYVARLVTRTYLEQGELLNWVHIYMKNPYHSQPADTFIKLLPSLAELYHTTSSVLNGHRLMSGRGPVHPGYVKATPLGDALKATLDELESVNMLRADLKASLIDEFGRTMVQELGKLSPETFEISKGTVRSVNFVERYYRLILSPAVIQFSDGCYTSESMEIVALEGVQRKSTNSKA